MREAMMQGSHRVVWCIFGRDESVLARCVYRMRGDGLYGLSKRRLGYEVSRFQMVGLQSRGNCQGGVPIYRIRG